MRERREIKQNNESVSRAPKRVRSARAEPCETDWRGTGMKNIMKLAVVSTLMAIGIATANAQSTNIVLRINVALSGFRQVDESNAAPVKITNKDIFGFLNATSNGFAFGKSAQLVLISSDSGDLPTFQVREKGSGTNVT